MPDNHTTCLKGCYELRIAYAIVNSLVEMNFTNKALTSITIRGSMNSVEA